MSKPKTQQEYNALLEAEIVALKEICNVLPAKWFAKGQNSVLRKNQSGCSCIINDDDEVVSVCGAHQDWADFRETARYEPSDIEILEAFNDWLDERPDENIRCYQPRMAWLEAWKRGMRFCPTKQKTSGKE